MGQVSREWSLAGHAGAQRDSTRIKVPALHVAHPLSSLAPRCSPQCSGCGPNPSPLPLPPKKNPRESQEIIDSMNTYSYRKETCFPGPE